MNLRKYDIPGIWRAALGAWRAHARVFVLCVLAYCAAAAVLELAFPAADYLYSADSPPGDIAAYYAVFYLKQAVLLLFSQMLAYFCLQMDERSPALPRQRSEWLTYARLLLFSVYLRLLMAALSAAVLFLLSLLMIAAAAAPILLLLFALLGLALFVLFIVCAPPAAIAWVPYVTEKRGFFSAVNRMFTVYFEHFLQNIAAGLLTVYLASTMSVAMQYAARAAFGPSRFSPLAQDLIHLLILPVATVMHIRLFRVYAAAMPQERARRPVRRAFFPGPVRYQIGARSCFWLPQPDEMEKADGHLEFAHDPADGRDPQSRSE